MKKRNNIYIILTYLFFIYPPFIWGLVLIYQEGNYGKEHITSLIINLILIAAISLVCSLLIYYKKLHKPNEREFKHLLFGIVGNIVVYFYTFQNLMVIDDYITVYLILLIVLGVHTLLISKRIMAKELWLLMSVFLVLDLTHLIGTGCGFIDGYTCFQGANQVFIYIIYSLMILTCLGFYSYKLYKLNQWDLLKTVNIVLILTMSIIIQNEDWLAEKFALTVMIALPFFTILDFIINIVNKRYTHRMLFHYLRAYALFLIFSIMGAMGFFYGEADYSLLSIMVTIAYLSLFITIFKYLLKVDSNKAVRRNKDILFGICNETHLKLIKDQFGEPKADYVSLNTEDFSLVAMKGDIVVGFMSTHHKPLTTPLESIYEASVEIIEVIKEYQKQGIATRFIEKTEKHFRNEGVTQIRAWTLKNNNNYINLWRKLDYCLSPTIVHYNEQEYLEGYHFIKKI